MNGLPAIQVVYAKVPDIECLGLCHRSCGPIRMTGTEQAHIAATHHITIPNSGIVNTCPALTILGRCGVYSDRPLICRLWGVVESMPCPHGCRPARYLTDAEGFAMLRETAHADEEAS